ncbi:MAG TPA: DUF3300 domain-containing protein [Verrucomicrobiota bacterium]|nr:DUF3300 domain-containing protein [Verrucomicrobiota bacterium]
MNYSFSFFRRFGWMIAAVVLLLPGRGQSPAAEPQLSQAELETLLGPIALYPDPLLSIVLPAACYPLEIVEAARFVANSNNIPKIDDQSWDVNVKSVAKIPAALKKLNDDLSWTSKLGQAFLNQQKDVMDTVQVLRKKAEAAGTLKTSEQQIVIVTNMVTEKTIESQVVVVTNTIVQIAPANPQIVYVPQYVPQAVYYPPPTYNPLAPLITFGAGIAVGAIIANNCDWHYGGVYVGGGWGYHGGTYVNNNVNININNNNINNINNINRPGGGPGQPWKPDSNRLSTAGAPGVAKSYQSREARGWDSGGGNNKLGSGAAGGPSATTFPGSSSRPTAGNTPAARPAASPAASRPAATPTPSVNRPNTANAPAARPAQTPAAKPAQSFNRPASQQSSAFSGMNSGGSGARAQSQRGAASRGGGGGGGARSGGGRR